MGASNNDIALTIVSNGETAHYSSVKGVGNIIWDIRFGIFNHPIRDAFTALDFTQGTDWEQCIQRLQVPLANPIYGTTNINFDLKTITDNNGFSDSRVIFFEWLLNSIIDARKNGDGIFPNIYD